MIGQSEQFGKRILKIGCFTYICTLQTESALIGKDYVTEVVVYISGHFMAL